MPEVGPGKFLVTAGWRDVPHLDEQTQQELLASTPPYLRAARSQGEPSLGAGAIYPIPVDEITVDPFPIPAWWPRVYGLDVGWKRTAAVWLAWDRENDLLYGYTEHYRGQAEPSIHANAIKARGDWIPGVIDPAARGRQQTDGQQLLASYRELGLKLTPADNAVEAGIYEVWERLSTGRLKLFKTMQNLIAEYRLYRRDEKGKIVKDFDHCLHPDTRVHTDRGLIPIRELVGTEGRVLTLGGRWTDYRNCRLTARSQRVVRVTFSDGSSVICTPDHRFMTPNGWVQAVDLRGLICYASVSQAIQPDAPCRLRLSPTPSRSSWASGIISAAITFSEKASAFIASCGRLRTAPLCLTDGTFTTRTTTRPTTRPQTSRSCLGRSTPLTTARARAMMCPKLPERLPGSGTLLRRAGSGTASTSSRTVVKSYTGAADLPASNVASLSLRRLTDTIAFVRTAAGQLRGVLPGWMMRIVSAPNAAADFEQTDTPASAPAARSVLLLCQRVEDAGVSDVYCLTVPETEAFAVEGGVIVHNCMDALRYAVMSGRAVAAVQPAMRDQGSRGSAAAGDSTAGY